MVTIHGGLLSYMRVVRYPLVYAEDPPGSIKRVAH